MKHKQPKITQRLGQAAVTDLFIAISVFIILITITTLTWNLYSIRLQNRFDYDDMMIKSFQVTDALVKSKGVPVDWETQQKPITTTANLQVIGLAKNERELSKEKLETFLDTNNLLDQVVKDTLRINLYDYYFVLRHFNGTIYGSQGATCTPPACATRGLFPSGNFAVNLARLVIFEQEPMIMEFAIWK